MQCLMHTPAHAPIGRYWDGVHMEGPPPSVELVRENGLHLVPGLHYKEATKSLGEKERIGIVS